MTTETPSKRLPLPRGAHAIADLRKLGRRPAEAVCVSFLGDTYRPRNPTVWVDSGRAYDWTWLRGLAVIVAVDRKLDTVPLIKAVAEATYPWPEGYVTVVEPGAGLVASVLSYAPRLKLWAAGKELAAEYLRCA